MCDTHIWCLCVSSELYKVHFKQENEIAILSSVLLELVNIMNNYCIYKLIPGNFSANSLHITCRVIAIVNDCQNPRKTGNSLQWQYTGIFIANH